MFSGIYILLPGSIDQVKDEIGENRNLSKKHTITFFAIVNVKEYKLKPMKMFHNHSIIRKISEFIYKLNNYICQQQQKYAKLSTYNPYFISFSCFFPEYS